MQVLADSTGFPLWVSDVHPCSIHDLTAARELVLPTLYPHATRGLPVLADKGYTGAGFGVHVPVRHHPHGPLHIDNRCYNQLITALRASTERGNALLGRWRALDRVTVCPQRIRRPPIAHSPPCGPPGPPPRRWPRRATGGSDSPGRIRLSSGAVPAEAVPGHAEGVLTARCDSGHCRE